MSEFILQQISSVGETLDQVHFSCKKVISKLAKYDANHFWLTMSVYELFRCPSYLL